jgi:hypothetical protein
MARNRWCWLCPRQNTSLSPRPINLVTHDTLSFKPGEKSCSFAAEGVVEGRVEGVEVGFASVWGEDVRFCQVGGGFEEFVGAAVGKLVMGRSALLMAMEEGGDIPHADEGSYTVCISVFCGRTTMIINQIKIALKHTGGWQPHLAVTSS